MQVKKLLAAFLIIVVAIGGFVAGLILLRQRQEIGKTAAVPGGDATVSFNPATGTYKVGDTIQTSIYFNTAGIPISGVAVRVIYPFSGSTPEVSISASDIVVNPTLLNSGDWTCPTRNPSIQGTNVVIDIGCANTSSAGFASSQNTLLANISLKIERLPSSSPLVLRFDPNESIITRRSDNQDILLIPTSTGEYVIEGVSQLTNTPTPSSKLTTTVTPTKKPSVTVSGTKTPTPTSATLPDAGVSTPTIFGLGLGTLLIAGALLLAL